MNIVPNLVTMSSAGASPKYMWNITLLWLSPF